MPGFQIAGLRHFSFIQFALKSYFSFVLSWYFLED
jgi:hypothetical protein